MTRPEEHADGDHRGAFPSSWGVPRGERGSEERAGWVLAQVRRLVIGRKQTPEQRQALLQRKRRSP